MTLGLRADDILIQIHRSSILYQRENLGVIGRLNLAGLPVVVHVDFELLMHLIRYQLLFKKAIIIVILKAERHHFF